MISNERSSPYGRRPHAYSSPKPPVVEETIRTDKVQIERKTFIFTLKENPRGRFLRITEDVKGHRDSIVIPSTGLDEFKRLFQDMLQTSNDTPQKALTDPD